MAKRKLKKLKDIRLAQESKRVANEFKLRKEMSRSVYNRRMPSHPVVKEFSEHSSFEKGIKIDKHKITM